METEGLILMALLATLCHSVWGAAQSGSCQFGQTVADGCVYLCHCEYQVPCRTMDGSCAYGGCTPSFRNYDSYTPSWSGPGCQLGDALHGKHATSGPEVGMDPNLALNGNTDPSGSCAISRSQDGLAAWWRVDMGDTFLVMSVSVTSSTDPVYLSHSRIDISPTLQDTDFQLCGNINLIRDAGDLSVECMPHRQGRYLRITRLQRGVHIGELRLCQAYVKAFLVRDCAPCYYGAGCLTACDCNGNACDGVTGECLSTSCSEVPTTTSANHITITESTTSAVPDVDLSDGLDGFPFWGIGLLVLAVLLVLSIVIILVVMYVRSGRRRSIHSNGIV